MLVAAEPLFGPERGGVLLAQAPGADAPPDLLAAKASRPPNRTVAILLLSGEEIGVPLSDIYTSVRRVIEANTALTVAPLDVIGLAEREAAIRNCAGSGKCFARKVRAGASSIGLLLTVAADRLDEGFLLGFRLVDVDTEEDLGSGGDEIPVGMSMQGAMEQQLPRVFPATIWGQVAALSIETEPPSAEVSLAGRSCVSPCEMTRISPGTHEIIVKKAGFLTWQGTVTLAPKQAGRITTKLEAPERGIVSRWWFWTAVGVAVFAGAAAAFVALRPDDRIVNICIADDRALCDS